jgi:hypothetical protein
MAGLSGEQVIVDIVALSEQLVPSRATSNETPERLEVASLAPTGVVSSEVLPWPSCGLGHQNHPDARFCANCGLPMDVQLPAVAAESARPRPAAELTTQEKAEREAAHQQAIAAAAAFEQAEPAYVPTEGQAIVIHFVADGLTAFGQVWYRGQELEIGPEHPRWTEALGWITLTRFQQVDRWGEQKFDTGPWPGRGYADAAGSFERLVVTDPQGNTVQFTGPTQEQLLQAEAAERRRGRAVPAAVFRA